MPGTVWIALNQGSVGGGEVMSVHIADAAAAQGFRVRVVTPAAPSDAAELAAASGHEVARLPSASRRSYAVALRRFASAQSSLQTPSPDSQSPEARRWSDLWWCNGLAPGTALAGMSRRVLHLHQVPRGKAQRAALAVARRGARMIVVPSDFVAAEVGAARVLPNWTAPFAPHPVRAMSPGLLRVGYLGRLSAAKGVDLLLDAATRLRQHHELRLDIAGDYRFVPDSDAEPLRRRLTPPPDWVRLHGWLAPQELFERIDVLVVPSRVPEAFGLVAAEALAARVPVVVSDAGALPEVVGQRHPWVYRSGDAADLARILSAVTPGSAQTSAVVEEGYRRWESTFSPAAGRERLAALLGELR